MYASFPNVLLIVNGEPYYCTKVAIRSHILDYGPCPVDVHPSQWPNSKITGYTIEAIALKGKCVNFTVDFLKHPETKITTFTDDSGRRILVLQNAHSA